MKSGLRGQKLGLEERGLMTKNDISRTFQSRVSQNQEAKYTRRLKSISQPTDCNTYSSKHGQFSLTLFSTHFLSSYSPLIKSIIPGIINQPTYSVILYWPHLKKITSYVWGEMSDFSPEPI